MINIGDYVKTNELHKEEWGTEFEGLLERCVGKVLGPTSGRMVSVKTGPGKEGYVLEERYLEKIYPDEDPYPEEA